MFGNLEPGKGTRRPSGTYFIPADRPIRLPGAADFAGPAPTAQERARAQFNWGASFPTPKNMPTKDPLAEMRGGSLIPSRLEAIGRAGGARGGTTRPASQAPAPTRTTGAGGGVSGVSSLFAPLFQALEQQRNMAESRYAENAGQIQNIYGQLIGARKADITDIQTAYQRLQTAAATRGAATLGAMEGREATRLGQNEAVLQSMGVGDIGTSAGDIAAQSSDVAQDVERMNQSNWAGMLDAMSATSQDIARADMTSYGFAQAEDIAALQGARENYMQDVANQEFDLRFQQQQAQLQAQQAAAANAARVRAAQIRAAQDAAEAAAKGQAGAMEDFMRSADPITRIIISAGQAQIPVDAGKLASAYESFRTNIGNPPRGQMQWDGNSAANAFATSPAATGLTQLEKRLIQQAIRDSF